MTDWHRREAALLEEWLSRRSAALKRRTSARLTAADGAFRAYREHLATRIPQQREAADGADAGTEPQAATAP